MTNNLDMDFVAANPEEVLLDSASTITMSELRRSKSPHIYVINTSDFEGTTQRGEIALKFLTDSGKLERVKIPDTWIPYDITQFHEKDKWIKDVGLDNTIRRGYLTIIDPNVAEAVLETSDAKAELKRIVKEQSKLSGHEEKVRRDTNKSSMEAKERYKAIDELKKINVEIEEEKSKVSPRVMTIMSNKNFEEIQKLAALKSAKSSITAADITYIMTNCGRDMPKIKEWALGLRSQGH